MGELIHGILINDDINDKDIDAIEENLSEVNSDIMISFVMDHNVPAPSVDAIKKHNRLKIISQKMNAEYIYGQGIGQHLLLQEGALEGKIIISNDVHISVIGAIGAVGISINGKDQWSEVLKEGKIDLSTYRIIGVKLVGLLKANVSITDVMLLLKSRLNFTKQNVIVEFVGDSVSNMSLSDKVKLTGFAPEYGAVTAVIKDSKANDNVNYYETIEVKLDEMLPVVQNQTGILTRMSEDVVVDQGFVGGCAIGIDDFRIAAKLLKDQKVAPNVKCIFSFT